MQIPLIRNACGKGKNKISFSQENSGKIAQFTHCARTQNNLGSTALKRTGVVFVSKSYALIEYSFMHR